MTTTTDKHADKPLAGDAQPPVVLFRITTTQQRKCCKQGHTQHVKLPNLHAMHAISGWQQMLHISTLNMHVYINKPHDPPPN